MTKKRSKMLVLNLRLFLAGDVSKWEMGNHDSPLSTTEL